jgi:alcohol dehydrogenase
VDPSPEARAAARRAGAEAVSASGDDVRDVHLGIEAIGDEAAVAASLAGLRKRGRHVQVGLLSEPPRVPMHLVIARELEVLGSHGMAAHAYPELLALRLPVGELVTREIGLDEAPDALMAMRGPGITVIRPRAPR